MARHLIPLHYTAPSGDVDELIFGDEEYSVSQR